MLFQTLCHIYYNTQLEVGTLSHLRRSDSTSTVDAASTSNFADALTNAFALSTITIVQSTVSTDVDNYLLDDASTTDMQDLTTDVSRGFSNYADVTLVSEDRIAGNEIITQTEADYLSTSEDTIGRTLSDRMTSVADVTDISSVMRTSADVTITREIEMTTYEYIRNYDTTVDIQTHKKTPVSDYTTSQTHYYSTTASFDDVTFEQRYDTNNGVTVNTSTEETITQDAPTTSEDATTNSEISTAVESTFLTDDDEFSSDTKTEEEPHTETGSSSMLTPTPGALLSQ